MLVLFSTKLGKMVHMGLPYTSENWQQQGDGLGRRNGQRVVHGKHFQDWYLYLLDQLFQLL